MTDQRRRNRQVVEPQTKVGSFIFVYIWIEYVSSGVLEAWRGVCNVR
jgi:hypothetical protein